MNTSGHKNRFHCKIDLAKGYYQAQMDPDSQKVTVFCHQLGNLSLINAMLHALCLKKNATAVWRLEGLMEVMLALHKKTWLCPYSHLALQ